MESESTAQLENDNSASAPANPIADTIATVEAAAAEFSGSPDTAVASDDAHIADSADSTDDSADDGTDDSSDDNTEVDSATGDNRNEIPSAEQPIADATDPASSAAPALGSAAYAPAENPAEDSAEEVQHYTDTSDAFDVFHWANSVDEVKNNISVELFLFNKNYTPFRVRYSDALTAAVKAIFLQEATGYIIKEADKGLECREYEKSDGEDKVIYRTKLAKVGRAETLIHLIEHEYRNIDSYTDHLDEFKKMKGILAKFNYPGDDGTPKTFYIAKAISPSSALKGGSSWELGGDGFEPFSAEIAMKMPEDNQVAIIDGNVVIFNQAKFENLFQYDFKSQVIADAKAKEITDKYKLSFAEGLTLNALLQDRKPLVKKLQSLDISTEMSQDKLIDYADDMQLELMTDDDGSIIIMDDKDLTMFVNLLAEDYFISPVNGRRYEIKSKKLLREPEGEPPRG